MLQCLNDWQSYETTQVDCKWMYQRILGSYYTQSQSYTHLLIRPHMNIPAGDDGAVSLLDKYPSLQKLAAAAFLAMQKKDIDTASARSTHRPRMPYFGLGRRTSLKQFVVDARDPNSLLFAAQHGHAEQIRRSCEGVLSSMSPDEEVDKNGLTALHYAAGKGDLEIVGLLLELKAGVDTRNKDGAPRALGRPCEVSVMLLNHGPV